jgi:pyrroline-5-carboxylate reductase
MSNPSIGFIGGGRVARIFLSGWKQANVLPNNIVVSDPNAETLAKLKTDFPGITAASGDNGQAAAQSVVFLAVHPPVMMTTLAELRGNISRETLVVSLAPKITLVKLSEGLGGHERLARMIPNAPSILGAGYNPMVFSGSLPTDARLRLMTLLAPLGDCPEVAEANLEAYALITGMGPTYFWFQLETLRELGRTFGLTDADLTPALKGMVCGAIRTLLESGHAPAQVVDLIPVKPLAENEAVIRATYQNRLPSLFAKIRP